MTIVESFAPHLPYVRRYARALTGSQSIGDSYVRAALTAVLCGKFELVAGAPPRVALYRLFHLIWTGAAGQLDHEIAADAMQPTPNRRLLALPSTERAALLLTAVEGI
jgi:response regulator PhyR-like protein